MGGWNYKGVSTNNRKRVLPSSGSLRLARGGGEGPGEGGCRQCKPLSSGRRGQWACSRGAGGGQWMTDPSALARGRIQTLEEESLPAGGPPDSSCRHHGASRPQGPRGWQSKAQGSPCFQYRKTAHLVWALSHPSTAELRGRTTALAGSMDSNMVRARILRVHGGPLGWGGGHR